jgi:hypothetical protein
MTFPRQLACIATIGVCVAPLMTAPAQAVTTVCTPAFGSSVSPGATISAVLSGPIPPCPSSPVSVSFNTGAADGNSGVVASTDIIIGPGTNDFVRTSPTSAVIGSNTTNQLISLAFTQPVQNPYLFFSFIDPVESFVFSQPFILAQASNATVSGSTVIASGTNSQSDGFVVQMLGTYSSLDFIYNNPTGAYHSVAFTTGVPVPGPLPLMGAGMAFGFSRKLRARLRA